MSPELIADVTKSLIGKRPNTYTLTKSIAEAVVEKEGADLPIAVVRPSIVTAVAKTPLPGWCDNINGPGGFYLAAAHNVLRSMPGTPHNRCDFVPVDHCVAMIIAVSWRLGVMPFGKPVVFNCSSGRLNPMTIQQHNDMVLKHINDSPILTSRYRRSHVSVVPRWSYDRLYHPLLHLLPALLIDTYRRVIGKKPMMMRLYDKVNRSSIAYVFFSSNGWVWDIDNSLQLNDMLREEDREAFDLRLTGLNWDPYLNKYYQGLKKFVKAPPAKAGMGGDSGAGNGSSRTPSTERLRSAGEPNLITSPSTASFFTNRGSSMTLNILAGRKEGVVPVAVATLFTSSLMIVLVAILLTFLHDIFFESNGPGGVMNATAAINFVSSLFHAVTGTSVTGDSEGAAAANS